MLGSYLITETLLRAIEAAANVLLRAIGGPDHVPQSNDDFVWF
jgi:hypothetical protein